MKTLVVGVDFSEPSRKAFETAVRLAGDLGASLVLVHALDPVPFTGARDPIGQVKAEIDAGKWRDLSAKWASEARRVVEVSVVGREGTPADVLLDVARERQATLVVVGSHGRTGLRRAVLGSVAEAVVRRSTFPVVVVPS